MNVSYLCSSVLNPITVSIKLCLGTFSLAVNSVPGGPGAIPSVRLSAPLSPEALTQWSVAIMGVLSNG